MSFKYKTTDCVATVDTNYFNIPEYDNKMTELAILAIKRELCQEQHEEKTVIKTTETQNYIYW